MIDFDEFALMIDKEITYARDKGKNHAYLKGLRDALKIAEYIHKEQEEKENAR